MKNNDAEKFFDEDLRCEKLIPIYMCLTDVPPDSFKDAVFEEPQVCKLLGIPLDVLDYEEMYDIVVANKKLGFLAQFATPRPIYLAKDRETTIGGWGFYATEWFYAETIEELESQALKWKQDFTDECISELRKRGKANE